jgi:hypothetical protein
MFRRFSIAVLFLVCLSSGGSLLLARQGSEPQYVTANGILMQAGSPLPIYSFAQPEIEQSSTEDVANRFSALAGPIGLQQSQLPPPTFEDSYRGKPRYTAPNTATNSLLTQYTATGGFQAYNVDEVGSDADRGEVNARSAQFQSCAFLFNNNFMDFNGNLLIPIEQDTITQGVRIKGGAYCVPQLQGEPAPAQETDPYEYSLVRLGGREVAGSNTVSRTIGIVVKIPLEIPVFRATAYPISGPGGHISFLIRTTNPNDEGPSLDQGTPGLAAVSMPLFARRFTFLKTAPAVDLEQTRNEAEQRVRAMFPNATEVNVPVPSFSYMVGEPGETQKAFEPMLTFEGVSVVDNGITINLKSFSLPAVEGGETGFGPEVAITSPANESTYPPDTNVTINGEINGGTAPYTYQWFLSDGTQIGSDGTAAVAGPVSVQTILPAIGKGGGNPSSLAVILRVEDAEGARREAVVSLRPTVAPAIFVPMVNPQPNQNPTRAEAAPQAALSAVNYTFGVESAADYPPYGPGGADLPGVPGDTNGLRNGLNGYGWGQRFSWSNASVWEKDWRDCSLGGGDCSYGVDRADLAYYSGHGGEGGLAVSSNNQASGWADGSNARFQQVRWAMFSSCQTLRVSFYTAPNEPIRRWFNSFQGAHMLLGFNSNMGDVAFGGPLVDNMRIPRFLGLVEMPWAQLSIRAAWVKTAFDMNAGKPAYIWATSATVNPADNKLPKGDDPLLPRPYPANWFYWVWWDCADTNPTNGLCEF